jgi:hypothetical protein
MPYHARSPRSTQSREYRQLIGIPRRERTSGRGILLSPHWHEEGEPMFGSIAASPQALQIPRDSALGDLDAELQKFSVDLGAPQSAFSAAMKRMRVRTSSLTLGRSSAARPRSPTPVQAKARPMPSHHRLRFHNDQFSQDMSPAAWRNIGFTNTVISANIGGNCAPPRVAGRRLRESRAQPCSSHTTIAALAFRLPSRCLIPLTIRCRAGPHFAHGDDFACQTPKIGSQDIWDQRRPRMGTCSSWGGRRRNEPSR